MRIAVIAALREELAPLARRLGNRALEAAGGWSDYEHEGRDLRLMVTGDGARPAGEGVRRLLDAGSVEVLIGVGAAGGLTADLAVGDLVVAERIVDEASGRTYRPALSPWLDGAAGAGAKAGAIVTALAIAVDSAAKQRLARLVPGPAVVDLESAVWAEAATDARVPFVLARAVSDAWDESLPLDFEALRDDRGSVDRRRVLAAALRRPLAWPALFGLQRRLARVGERLADWGIEVLAA